MDSTRFLLGLLTAGAAGYGVWAWVTDDLATGGIMVRVALVLAAVWVAWPSLRGVSPRTWLVTAVAVVVIAWRPLAAWIVLPMLALGFARPRRSER